MKVPFFRPSVGEGEIEAVTECLRSGWLTTGPKTKAFEEEFADVISGGVEALAVNSATAGLHLALEALGIGPGDEVIVPTLTFTATAEVVRYVGATPCFVDIDLQTLCVNPKDVERAINARTRAIMPVHFGGRPCDMTALGALARQHNLKIVADAAHALPAFRNGKHVGHDDADATVFSFYANKTITTGEGGMLVSANAELVQRARKMRLHGIDRDVFNRFSTVGASWQYDVVAAGFKYNMTDIAAAMGLVQLKRRDEFWHARQKQAARYSEAFADLPFICPAGAAAGDEHSWHLYLVQLLPQAKVNRDRLIAGLNDAGIGTSVHYRPLHQMTYWKAFAGNLNFPNADTYYSRCLTLPVFASMTVAEQDHVIATVRDLVL